MYHDGGQTEHDQEGAIYAPGGCRRTPAGKADWNWGCVSAIDSNERTIWIADAHHDNGKRFVVRAEDLLSALIRPFAYLGALP